MMMELPPFYFWFGTLFVFFSGLCLGSFFNVCIWRIPRGESIVWPGSHCPKCNHVLAAWENVPLLSWLVLGGRCRQCRERISFRYFGVELLTAVLFTWVWWCYGWSVLTLLYIVFTGALLVGSFIDVDHMILPDRITLGGMAAGPVLSVLFPALHGESAWQAALGQSCLGMAVGFGSLWLVAVVGRLILRKDAMGFGDVKLLGAIGACLGWKAVLFTILFSSLTGSLLGVGLMAAGKKELQSRLPYGPHIAAAAYVWMVAGHRWMEWYLGWVMGAA